MRPAVYFFHVIFYVRRIFESRIIRRGWRRQRERGSGRRFRENKARLRVGKRPTAYYVVRKKKGRNLSRSFRREACRIVHTRIANVQQRAKDSERLQKG